VTQRYEKLGQSESESDWSRDEKKEYSQDEGETDVEMSEVIPPHHTMTLRVPPPCTRSWQWHFPDSGSIRSQARLAAFSAQAGSC
jgi:hypothetical protein